MKGAHDMGGIDGFGPVLQEPDEPVFHADWEARCLALNLAAGANGRWNIDMSRFARENTPPADYLRRSYYETWLYGLETVLVQESMVTETELADAGRGATFAPVTEPPLTADRVEAAMRRGGSTRVDVDVAPLFAAGASVRVRALDTVGHTRTPAYVSGRVGIVDRDHGVFVFPDTNAHGKGPNPQHVYSVRFESAELWGQAGQGGAVYVDLWDGYLEAVK